LATFGDEGLRGLAAGLGADESSLVGMSGGGMRFDCESEGTAGNGGSFDSIGTVGSGRSGVGVGGGPIVSPPGVGTSCNTPQTGTLACGGGKGLT
jgi:hypothetical protein